MKATIDMDHCDILDAICHYEHSCSVCRLHRDYETAKEKAKKLVEKLEEGSSCDGRPAGCRGAG